MTLHFFALNASAKKEASATLDPDVIFFSPNADGKQDSINFKINTDNVKNVSTWEIQFRDATGVVRKTISGLKKVPESVHWDGLDDFGAPSLEGAYDATIKVWLKNGDKVQSPHLGIILDITPPTVSIDCSSEYIFIKEGLMQPAAFNFSAVDLSGIAEWTLSLTDEDKREIYVDHSTQALPQTWTTKEQKLNYNLSKITAQLLVKDLAGNPGSSPPTALLAIVQSQSGSEGNQADLSSSPPPVASKNITKSQTKVSEPDRALPTNQRSSNQKTMSYFQMTSIISIIDLFGANATFGSPLLPQAKILLEPLARTLREAPGAKVTVIGHVESMKSGKESKSHSSHYAWRVFSYLVKEGALNKEMVAVKGLRSEVPIADNSTRVGRERNRRIEIQLFLPAEQ